ncbi:hypothetical protein [Flavobacterium sp. 3HN19-14]|uniref:hypothetical protein n=1 Tax=Flavobacterium sp. 3HN19-14 TaxID=3448133 RepID=UPI003EE21A66
MKQYFDLLALQEKPFAQKKKALEKVLKSKSFYPLKEEAVFQMKNVPFAEKKALVVLALGTNDIHVRQAIANTTATIPVEMYGEFVKLLDDKSYLTQEIVMGNLWKQFPEKQTELLDKTQNETGFNDRNLRVQWLTLALMTKEYQKDSKSKFYDELLDYSTPKYESQLRQNAITNLFFLNPNDVNVLKALAAATVHHKWQFTKFARDKIRSLLKKEKYRTYYMELLAKLPDKEQAQIDKLLKEK